MPAKLTVRLALGGALVLSGLLLAASPVTGGTSVSTEVGSEVEARSYRTLLAENEALRRENQMLRRELVAKRGTLPDSSLPQKVADMAEPSEKSGEDTGYWLSAKSKIRHNGRCRNYRRVKGRPCGPKDGKACKVCGG